MLPFFKFGCRWVLAISLFRLVISSDVVSKLFNYNKFTEFVSLRRLLKAEEERRNNKEEIFLKNYFKEL